MISVREVMSGSQKEGIITWREGDGPLTALTVNIAESSLIPPLLNVKVKFTLELSQLSPSL